MRVMFACMPRACVPLACVLVAVSSLSAAAKPTRFWNLTDNTITEVSLAPAGTDKFGPNQALNEKDKSVEHDERAKMKDLPAGTYDVKIVDEKGRKCLVKNIVVKDGDVFSIEEKQLAGNCQK